MSLETTKNKYQSLASFALLLIFFLLAVFVFHYSHTKISKVSSFSESPLSIKLANDSSVVGLDSDLTLAKTAVKQELIDANIAKSGKPPMGMMDKGKNLSGNKAIVKLLDMQLTAALALKPADAASLESQVNAMQTNSQDLNKLVPRVSLLKAADDQQAAETILSGMRGKLAFAINQANKQGVTVTDLQADMTTFIGDISAARNLSSPLEINLADNNLNQQQILSSEQQLLTANRDIQAAINAGSSIIGILKY